MSDSGSWEPLVKGSMSIMFLHIHDVILYSLGKDEKISGYLFPKNPFKRSRRFWSSRVGPDLRETGNEVRRFFFLSDLYAYW